MTAHPGEFALRYTASLEQIERLPFAQIVDWQYALLKRLVAFAFKESPFYRERLAPLFRREDEIDLSAWSEVPLLRRADLESEIDRINPAEVPADIGQVFTTRSSGTTGNRLTFRTCMLSRMVAECMMQRMYRWHEFDLQSPMASIRYYSSGRRVYPDGVTEERWCYAAGPAAPHYTIDLHAPVEHLIEWLVRRRPTYLLTFPSIAHEIAQHRDAPLVRALGLKAIVGISEIAPQDTRVLVRERLGCEILQIYACAEMGCIALQPPSGEHLLNCAESVLIEILGDDGKPARPGETGRVVLTSLYNYATPFIRYEIGDFATYEGHSHPFEPAFERLQRVEGRRRNALVTVDGERVWPSAVKFRTLAAEIPVRRFQIRQPDLGTIELAYVPDDSGTGPDVGKLTTRFAEIIGRPIDLTLSRVKRLERTPGGKLERIVTAVLS